jgi:hypothetical protein
MASSADPLLSPCPCVQSKHVRHGVLVNDSVVNADKAAALAEQGARAYGGDEVEDGQARRSLVRAVTSLLGLLRHATSERILSSGRVTTKEFSPPE